MAVTPFQQRVYRAVSRIPEGKVATYRGVADFIGCGAPRAVGQALKVNPYAPQVPCHRVIATNLTLGGFQGELKGSAIQRKRCLLAREGVLFKAGCLLDPRCVFDFRRSGYEK